MKKAAILLSLGFILVNSSSSHAFWGNKTKQVLGTWNCKSTIEASDLTMYTSFANVFSNNNQFNTNGIIVYSHSGGPSIKYRINARGDWSLNGDNLEVTSTNMDAQNISNPPSDFPYRTTVWRDFLDKEFGHKEAFRNSKGITTYSKILELDQKNFVTRSSAGILNNCLK